MPTESDPPSGDLATSDAQTPDPATDAPKGRLTLLAVTWIIALVATSPDPRSIVVLPIFPLGLVVLNPPKLQGALVPVLLLGWLVYVVLSACVLRTRRKGWVFLVYAALVVMLLANIAGCRMSMHAMRGEH